MNLKTWNLWIFVALNILWVALILPINTYHILIEIGDLSAEYIRILLITLVLSASQIIGYLNLRKGNIYPAIIAIIALSLMIDVGDFKMISKLLLNIELLYTASGDFIFDLNFFQGPHAVFNMRLSEFTFNQIGFNAVGLIQIFMLYKQNNENKDLDFEMVNKSNEIL